MSSSRADNDLDDLIAEIIIDTYDEDEALTGFENAFDEADCFPARGTVIGEDIEILSVATSNRRHELIATCQRTARRHQIALLDIDIAPDQPASHLLAAYRAGPAPRVAGPEQLPPIQRKDDSVSTLWILATVLQWVVIIALAVITLSLVRQFGIVAIRLNPSAGMETSEGPGPGTELVAQQVSLLSGGTALFGGQRERPLVTVFLSPDCSICNTVARHVGTVARDYRDDLDLRVVIHATPRVAREYARDHSFDEIPVAIKQNFPSNHGISTTPFALALTADGTVAARGVPNALEHLEEMVAQARDYDPAEDGAYAAELGPVVDDAPSHNWLNVMYPSAAIAAKGEEA